jgi:hypothetical protein
MSPEIIRAGCFLCQAIGLAGDVADPRGPRASRGIATQHVYAQNNPKHQRYSAIGIWRMSKFGQYARLWKT